MRRILLVIFSVLIFLSAGSITHAVEDPRKTPNNKIGIHILFPAELEEAARLVNSNGGDWGYVTIPIQAGDRDLEKWQKFMDDCKRLHLIPLVRLATEGDYFNTKVWREPKEEDIIDFANFLHSLDWPTRNRYVIVFNEVNRGDEWGGMVKPDAYARLLSYSASVFKSKHLDFFIISAGLDNGAPNQGTDYMDQYDYLRRMNEAVPGIFNQIDGFSSHSYPNPAFSQPPTVETTKSITSFRFEQDLIKSLGGKDLPIFITETGWTAESVDDTKRAEYYTQALDTHWEDARIVAITPFLLRAGGGPFTIFSFLKDDGSITKQYEAFQKLSKIKGSPSVIQVATAEAQIKSRVLGSHAVKDFSNLPKKEKKFSLSLALHSAFKWIMKI
jgi:hypothetical protein